MLPQAHTGHSLRCYSAATRLPVRLCLAWPGHRCHGDILRQSNGAFRCPALSAKERKAVYWSCGIAHGIAHVETAMGQGKIEKTDDTDAFLTQGGHGNLTQIVPGSVWLSPKQKFDEGLTISPLLHPALTSI